MDDPKSKMAYDDDDDDDDDDYMMLMIWGTTISGSLHVEVGQIQHDNKPLDFEVSDQPAALVNLGIVPQGSSGQSRLTLVQYQRLLVGW